jgi:hypothetical protein
MGLFNFFKSESENKYLGNSVTCEVCGKKYYELKANSLPMELIGKYRLASVYTCKKCGRVYCGVSYSFGSPCMTQGCKCSKGLRSEFTVKPYVEKVIDRIENTW